MPEEVLRTLLSNESIRVQDVFSRKERARVPGTDGGRQACKHVSRLQDEEHGPRTCD